jgi:hypothetical protein
MGSCELDEVKVAVPTGTGDGVDVPGGVLRFRPDTGYTGRPPVVLPAPDAGWSTHPVLLRAMGVLMLLTGLVVLVVTLAFWEASIRYGPGEFNYGPAWSGARFPVGFSIATWVCFKGARRMIVRDDAEWGFMAAIVLDGALLMVLVDGGVIDLYGPAGAFSLLFVVIILAIPLHVGLHIVRRRRARIEEAEREWRSWGPVAGHP